MIFLSFSAAGFRVFSNITEILFLQRSAALRVHDRCTAKGIGNPQQVVFMYAQPMIREKFYPKDSLDPINVTSEGGEMLLAVGK